MCKVKKFYREMNGPQTSSINKPQLHKFCVTLTITELLVLPNANMFSQKI